LFVLQQCVLEGWTNRCNTGAAIHHICMRASLLDWHCA
jgi:hypothetical protein